MNSNYLCPKLKKLSGLMYSNKKGYIYAFKTKNRNYSFGIIGKKFSINNLVSKQVAMYLCIEQLPKKKKK